MNATTLKISLGLLCLLLTLGFRVHGMTPLELVDETVTNVVADMNSNQDIYGSNPRKLRAMVLERVAPHFDFGRMTQLALGQYWGAATPAQRSEIRDSMLNLMVRTYAQAMFEFRNAPVTVIDQKQTSERSAVVRLSVTNTSSGQPVGVLLRMERRDERWQVIDVVVGGVSMVITYRGVFALEISRSGIDGLIASIKQDNLERPAP